MHYLYSLAGALTMEIKQVREKTTLQMRAKVVNKIFVGIYLLVIASS